MRETSPKVAYTLADIDFSYLKPAGVVSKWDVHEPTPMPSQNSLIDLLNGLIQREVSGGVHTPPELRLFLLSLVLMGHYTDILETGYDFAYTTLALAMTGANVTAVENFSNYGYDGAKLRLSRQMLQDYPNCKLINGDALRLLQDQDDESFDLIFIDDSHSPSHVKLESVEVRRILRPNGVAVFHDVVFQHNLWLVIGEIFPDWEHMRLPCYTPASHYAHKPNFGVGIVRKPVIKDN